MESEQLRRENDSSGPQDELEYWKKRGALFSQLVLQLEVTLDFQYIYIKHILFQRLIYLFLYLQQNQSFEFCALSNCIS